MRSTPTTTQAHPQPEATSRTPSAHASAGLWVCLVDRGGITTSFGPYLGRESAVGAPESACTHPDVRAAMTDPGATLTVLPLHNPTHSTS